MTTLKDIANVCGVSVCSVSKALNHAPDIGADTAERIRNTARELGYRPNAAARALKTNRTYNVGVLFEDDTHSGLTHEYFSAVLNAVKNVVESRGYDVTFISKNLGGARMSFLEHCEYRNCDGVVVANVDFNDPDITELINSRIPVVTIDYIFDNRGAVLSDNVQGMRELVEYIYGMGHRSIALIHGEETAVTRSRLASFYKTCQELGIAVPPEYVIRARYHDPHESILATRRLLELDKLPTCILYPDDVSLLGGRSELESHGLRVPEDISIAGYDGIHLSQILRPALTTLHQDSEALGSQAAQMLIDAIENPKTYIPELVFVPGKVFPGGTVREI